MTRLDVVYYTLHSMVHSCDICGGANRIDIEVPRGVWDGVMPPDFDGSDVCLACFDEISYQKGINYVQDVADPAFMSPTSGEDFEPPLDPGIEGAVLILRKHGVETYESCDGSDGHAYPEPTVMFHGSKYEGFRVLSVALMYGLPVRELSRAWSVSGAEPTGPDWKLVFSHYVPLTEEVREVLSF